MDDEHLPELLHGFLEPSGEMEAHAAVDAGRLREGVERVRPLGGNHVVDVRDVPMLELRERESFLVKARPRRLVRKKRRREHLDRDLALKPRVACPVDLPHPAGAERAQDFVRPQT